jgi:uncharacterized protein (TIGR00725 family)
MSATFSLDRATGVLRDGAGRRFDPVARTWQAAPGAPAAGEVLDVQAAARWLQRESGHALRVPVGVIGPREATQHQLAWAEAIGAGVARIGIAIVCGGRHGVMEAVCRGVAAENGVSIGLLPDPDARHANPHLSWAIATGIGEARNALIARAALCLVAIGDSYGTLSEVALGLQFGKRVIGLEAATVAGVDVVRDPVQALDDVAEVMLATWPH